MFGLLWRGIGGRSEKTGKRDRRGNQIQTNEKGQVAAAPLSCVYAILQFLRTRKFGKRNRWQTKREASLVRMKRYNIDDNISLFFLLLHRKLCDLSVLPRQQKIPNRFAGQRRKHSFAFPMSRKDRFKETGSHDHSSQGRSESINH